MFAFTGFRARLFELNYISLGLLLSLETEV
jgi:hypothetical protein